MTCAFCHNEGTPVVSDNLGRHGGQFAAVGRSGRVSIYAADNGVRFLPATVAPDDEFAAGQVELVEVQRVAQGGQRRGEPTLHPRLPEIVRRGRDAGLRVCMTSNGENGARVLAQCAQSGLDRVNFSIFGTTAAELAQVQHGRYAGLPRAERKITAIWQGIRAALSVGIRASANIVVPDRSHSLPVRRLLTAHSPDLSVRLPNSLDEGEESIQAIEAIEAILADLNAVPIARHVPAGTSGCRTAYQLPDGRVVLFKQIRPVRLPTTCAGCRFNNGRDCQEGYYGVRLYRDRAGGYQVGVCIQRMDLRLAVDEFVRSDLCREVLALRDAEYGQLSAAHR